VSSDDGIVLELCGGPGGLSEALRRLGIARCVGLEIDKWACATRAAAGHRTIRCDISEYPVSLVRRKVAGVCGSPPCVTYSAAGDRAGMLVTAPAESLIRDLLAGRDTRDAHRVQMAAVLAGALPGWPTEKVARTAASAALVAEPARFIHACRPEWVALEQVPAVLPLWKVYASELRARGYRVWTGVLNAADYGVPQVRLRAILIASLVRYVACPPATHYDPRRPQLLGEPWVSMPDALGWGPPGRPAPTVTAGGTASGGAETFGHRSRDMLEAERDAGRWVPRQVPSWVWGRPATTVQGDGRLGRPGHKNRDRGGESQFAEDSVRVTPEEAAILQGFPPGYPFQGTKTARSRQIGDAWPPPLAFHVLAEATGIRIDAEAAA
jgi:DNA (cytosine-5)-methyltransferase 1